MRRGHGEGGKEVLRGRWYQVDAGGVYARGLVTGVVLSVKREGDDIPVRLTYAKPF